MLQTPKLNSAHISEFKSNGFVVNTGGFSAEDIAIIDDWTSKLALAPEEVGKHWVYHEPSHFDKSDLLINRIENIAPFHEGFNFLAKCLSYSIGQLMSEKVVLFKDKINFKMPGGDGFKPHQDVQAGWGSYASYFISAMVCIDEATEENGCLKLANNRKNNLIGSIWEPLKDSELANLTFRSQPTRPGDIIYFDSYVPHYSEPNKTNHSRRLYFATYNLFSEGNHSVAYFSDKRKNYPPDIEREEGKEYVFRV
ncbi:MAG: phytanoyl-CoA dioxygenase family protein [Pseudomonadota bacterium]|nr:phytanoyl-CoA dioxygenase family protein [Pseudomonadota bacterium]